MTQLDLLSNSPIARRNDPSTSHEAAEHIERTGARASQQRAVMHLVERFPGHTSAELAAKSSLDRWTLARRLPELRSAWRVKNGDKRVCGATGLRAMTWYPY